VQTRGEGEMARAVDGVHKFREPAAAFFDTWLGGR
jgi:hypothetical protein